MNEPSQGRRVGRLPLGLAFLAVYVIWGSTYLAIRFGVESMPPFLMAATRHSIPGLVLVGWASRRGARRPTGRQWRDAVIVGLFLLLGANGLVTWAEQWVPSALTALLLASVPLWMGVANRMVEPESRPGALGVTGILVGFAGVGLLLEPHGELSANARTLAGSAGILVGATFWAAGSLYARRADLPRDNALSTGMQMLGGAAGLFVTGTLAGEWARVDVGGVTGRSLVALLYLIVFGSLVAFSAYVWLLQVAAPAKVATYAYVNPVVAVFLGWALGGEAVSVRTLVASAVIVGAVVMITVERARAGAARARPATDVPREEPA